MKKSFTIIFIIFRDIVMILTFVLAVLMGQAGVKELLITTAIFFVFLIWMHLREIFLEKCSKVLTYTFSVDVLLLILLDHSVETGINYYFNVFYFFVLISAGYLLGKRKSIIMGQVVLIAALVKYYVFAGSYNSVYQYSNICFTIAVLATISVFFNYSRIVSDEQSRVEELKSELQKAEAVILQKDEKLRELAECEDKIERLKSIQDSVNQRLGDLIIDIDYCQKNIDLNHLKVKSQLVLSKESIKECMKEIRRSSKKLKTEEDDCFYLIKSLDELVENAKRKYEVDIFLKIDGTIFETIPYFNIVIYRAIQEAIINSVKHGKATCIEVIVNYTEKDFNVTIRDNGTGASKISIGSGLTGIAERMKQFRGEVNFSKNGGFVIDIVVPTEDVKNE